MPQHSPTYVMHRIFHRLSLFMAYLGGTMLVALILLTCISVLGRSLNSLMHSTQMENLAPTFAQWVLGLGVGPVNGDFELIEAGIAFAIFAFLPLCQFTCGHATVEIFTHAISGFVNRILQLFIDIIFALVLVLIAFQLFRGMISKMDSGQTTLLLEFPVWWAYAICMSGATVAAIVGLYIVAVRTLELSGNKRIMGSAEDTAH